MKTNKMASKFSGALQITDLNDFITPSQECIKPVEIKTTGTGTGSKIKIETDGYYEIEERTGKRQKLEKVEITLGDCLACSGCITSAEGVLINQQNHTELLRAIKLKEEGETAKVVVSLSIQSVLSLAEKYKLQPEEAAGRVCRLFKQLGVDKVYDLTVADDLALLESGVEFVERYRSKRANVPLPMLASSCPGWICYAEKTHGSFILPHISTTKSAQQIMGSMVKEVTGAKGTYHVTLMPCYDKKLEASRAEFFNKEENSKDVDCVITPIELEQMMSELKISFEDLKTSPLDSLWGKEGQVLAHAGSGSGGFAHFIYHYAARELFDIRPDSIEWKPMRNPDLLEATLEKDGNVVLRFAIANGFRNIQNIVQKLKRKKCPYDYVEIMACPGGCLNGGAQIRPDDVTQTKEVVARLQEVYANMPKADDSASNEAYKWLGGRDSDKCKALLHTMYHAVEKMNLALNIKW